MAEAKAHILIPASLRNRLKKLAAVWEVPIQSVAETAIENFIDKNEKKNGGKKSK